MRTLKQEEIHCAEYRDLDALRAHLEAFIDRYYNASRLHSALGYRSPEEFEREQTTQPLDALPHAPRISFFRHQEIYPPDVQS